jgi:hypothetical protein
MQLQRWVCWGALLGGLLSSGCPGDDTGPSPTGPKIDSGIDAPADVEVADGPAVLDGPADGLVCSPGYKPYYRDPGCGGEAVAVCAQADDACFGEEICLCDGRNSRRCSWSSSPYRHVGPCGGTDAPTEGGTDGTDAPTSCPCGSGRTCPINAIFASSCSVCQCQPEGQAICQAILCQLPDSGVPPEAQRCEAAPGGCAGDCIFDQGCDAPRAYCSPTKCSNTFGEYFCGCDGVTFTSDCPRKPYRHVGACL